MKKSQPSHLNYSYLPEIVGHLSSLIFLRATDIAVEHLSELGLTTKEFVTLEFIGNNAEASQIEIAEATGTKPQLLVKILDDLTKRGLLKRERSETDRRRQHVHLTADGERLRGRMRELALAADQLLLDEAAITPQEKETLVRLMQKLAGREQKAD